MYKLTIFLFLIIIPFRSFCQSETKDAKIIVDKFTRYYNNANYDSIFSMFSVETQKALPLEKLSQFLKGLNAQVGSIKQTAFVKYNDSYAVYKANFEKALFALNISLDQDAKINGLSVTQFKDESAPQLLRNSSKLDLPFKGEWTVIWGGDSKEQNHHHDIEAQKFAFDLIMQDAKGNSYKTDGKTNEDYYAFGKELYAACDGEVVLVVDGVKDNQIGETNTYYVPGNSVIIKTANNEYLVYCHFKEHSIIVKEGQTVKRGQELGLCGNSGNSSEPHLHFHIQNIENMNTATGAKCYFEKLKVNGVEKTDYSPVKNEKIQ